MTPRVFLYLKCVSTSIHDTPIQSISRPSAMAAYLVAILLLLGAPAIVESRLRRFTFHVKEEVKSPDCIGKSVITVNRMFPGPTLEVDAGDISVVRVINMLNESMTIHWHGIRQLGSPWADGTEGVTQCPILAHTNFTYKFLADKPGTFLWHSHSGLQRMDGCYGAIKVSTPKRQPQPLPAVDDRNIILLSDWYHAPRHDLAAGLQSIPFRWVGEPQSILINGRGRFNCSSDSSRPFLLSVIPRTTYRLRIGSLTTLSALSFQIENHTLTVVEADGHYVKPFEVKNLFIYSGETYSVILRANQSPSFRYRVIASVVGRNSTTPPAIAVLQYKTNKTSTAAFYSPNPPQISSWNDVQSRVSQSKQIKALPGFVPLPPKFPSRRIILLNTQNKVDNHTRWALNNVSLTLPETPYIISLKKNLLQAFDQIHLPDSSPSPDYDIYAVQKNQNAVSSSAIYTLELDSVVDVVLQNSNALSVNVSETHPWHLHGHDFWVLGYGDGKFQSSDEKMFNLVDPIMKNTVPIHPYGWTAIRFMADNPGVWLFHCHIDAHFAIGMGVVFAEGPDKIGRLPSTIMGCGLA